MGDPSRIGGAIAGDSGALIGISELKTAMEYSIPVLVFVFNDGRNGFMHHWSNMIYGKPAPGSSFKQRIDFAQIAKGMGVEAVTISKPGEISRRAISYHISKNKPVVFDCHICPEEQGILDARVKNLEAGISL